VPGNLEPTDDLLDRHTIVALLAAAQAARTRTAPGADTNTVIALHPRQLASWRAVRVE